MFDSKTYQFGLTLPGHKIAETWPDRRPDLWRRLDMDLFLEQDEKVGRKSELELAGHEH